jgi:hypothetical protein
MRAPANCRFAPALEWTPCFVDNLQVMTGRVFACVTLASALSVQHGHSVMYHFPQWSPDGTTILVSATLDGDSEIYLLPIDGSPARPASGQPTSDRRCPAWPMARA